MQEKRYEGLDVLKAICAFLVVCIHVPTSLEIYKSVVILSRVAVPIFFMITGFFWDEVVIAKKERKQAIKILKLIVTSIIVYLMWTAIYGNLIGRNLIKNYVKIDFFLNELRRLIVFNLFSLAGHLWYLFAILYIIISMIYIYIYIYISLKHNKLILYMLVIILFFCQLLLGNYSWIINKYFLPEITRNFLITGLPYFWLGMITKEHIKMIKVNFFTWKIIIILGLISLIEANLLEYVNWIIDKDIYITTILLSYAIFIKMIYINNKFLFNISFIGKKYSTQIYIWHPIFHTILFFVSKKLGILKIYEILAPVLVFVSIIVCCIFCKNIKNRFKNNIIIR